MYPDVMSAFYTTDPNATDKPTFQKELQKPIEDVLFTDLLIDRYLYEGSSINIAEVKNVYAKLPQGLPAPAKIEFMLAQKEKFKHMGISKRDQTLLNV